MTFLQETGRRISQFIAVVTDWLLIVMGLLLVLIAVIRIDVMIARYVVVAGGLALSGFGFWFRHRRLKRERE
ncbi:MAG: hypothetical protein ACL93V_15215 [Candidatus Electrothrix sp. YB6]